ncbi:hypothetical protein [Noviherbaspirillum pedocola]|uniref:Uncharacterized protein n=1 Tax=Noviherbaspirillum pedocola TaxID=2801341 RepID=A0A934T2D5_9BURK|nr:hypothetical protein [Noviherbaspirillum pedocola]MBK4736583.1 hypothetical protein [Noviherbaspirillum pedocola]
MRSSARADASRNDAGNGGRDARQAPVLAIVPANDPDRPPRHDGGGCWLRLMDNLGAAGGSASMTIIGAKYMPDLKTVAGEDWSRKMDGVSIGPDALVTILPEPGYRGHPVTLRPNEVLQDLRRNSGFLHGVESLKVDCRG